MSTTDSNSQVSQSSPTKKHFSIDLSLALERQLTDMESPPATPAHSTHKSQDSLDPGVLAHIVRQLQQSLTDMTNQRDELVKLLSTAHSQEAHLKDALQLMTDKATEVEENLTEARKKMKDDEDAITMLRAKVEESRRGLMRLQTESRRQTINQPDSRAGMTILSSPSSKRNSFTPLTGSLAGRPNGHRRIASVSDTNIHMPDALLSPNAQMASFQDAGTPLLNAPPVSSRRFSGLFGRQSPPNADVLHPDPVALEIETLRKDLREVREDLEKTRHELSEAVEAREASDMCVQTLRSFIADNNVGVSNAAGETPLSPTTARSRTSEEPETRSGWGFKIWKAEPQAPKCAPPGMHNNSSATTLNVTPSPIVSTSASAMSSPQAPLSRKLGGFFSSRTSSVSSNANSLPQLQTNAAHRDSMYSFSDASSVAEPISPGSDIDGLGTGRTIVMGRDVTNLSDNDVGKALEAGKAGTQPRLVLD